MKKASLILALLFLVKSSEAQTWSENFNNGLPSNWLLVDNDGLTPEVDVSYVDKAWVTDIKLDANSQPINGDSVLVSTSYYTSPATADDWVITPSFTVGSTAFVLKWDEYAYDPSYPDGYEVRVSTTGSNISDFSTVLYSTSAASATAYTSKFVSLGAYNGQTIRIAFRNNSHDMFVLAIDNISVSMPNNNDLALTAITPASGSAAVYGVTGANMVLGGTVLNAGLNAVTSFKVHYRQGTGPVTTDVINANIPFFGTYAFTSPTSYQMPATAGNYPIEMWVELTGDADVTNDTGTTDLVGVAFKPTKKILLEEGTGTWCGWCPRGTVYMDSLWHDYPQGVSPVAVHNGDPMVNTVYDDYIANEIPGFPNVLIDRKKVFDPLDIIDAYNDQKDNFGYADIVLTDLGANGFNYSVKATVKLL